MRFSQQVTYALRGLFDLAYHAGSGPLQVRAIGERQEVPTRYLEQIFQRLRKAELVVAKRGPGGGYRLARAPRDITLREIVEAVEGQDALQVDAAPGGPDFVWQEVADRFGDVLSDISLEAVCSRAARTGIPRAGADAVHYEI